MSAPFDWFVVLAGMRTGSNFLESNLNAIKGLTCFGEAFNPSFIGYPKKSELLGFSLAQRDANPNDLIDAIQGVPAQLCGFRLFHNHDHRVINEVLNDPRCAKIILTRNPLDSYVSLKIAKTTEQWKLTDVKRRKDSKAVFDPLEFAAHLDATQAFQLQIQEQLQTSGQTAFYVGYSDLRNLDVINGLARWLGVPGKLSRLDHSLKPQNPGAIFEKVSNPQDLRNTLASFDRFDLSRTPNFEPRRGPAVPGFIAAPQSGLLYMPIPGTPETEISAWMAALDDATIDDLKRNFSQKTLRKWKRTHAVHRSFTVLRHPAARAHSVFCQRFLTNGPGSFASIRDTLRRQFKLPVSKSGATGAYDIGTHRRAFEIYLKFVQANIAGQTTIRVDGAWSTQTAILNGFAGFASPDFVFREEELSEMLPMLAQRVNCGPGRQLCSAAPDVPFSLSQIYDADLEKLVSKVYQRDYLMFGFGPWKPDQAA